jgi:hypothetical protein
MVEDEVQRTRCVVCDAEHEFKNAKMPAARKKSSTAALFTQVLDNLDAPLTRRVAAGAESPPAEMDAPVVETESDAPPESVPGEEASPDIGDDRPFRRSLIRAQLPRPEGQPPPTRAIPEFTMHQPLNNRPKRPGQGRFRRRPGGAPDGGGPMRFGRDQGNSTGAGGGQGGRRRRRKKH